MKSVLICLAYFFKLVVESPSNLIRYQLLDWLSMSVRGVYTSQGQLHGEYNKDHRPIGPMDSPESYGGEYYDLGLGINAMLPTGDLAGNSLSVEWLQPMEDDVNGLQLERGGFIC